MDAEENFIQIIKETIQTGGNVLIPVFSVGRAQEIILVIEQYYRTHGLEAKVYVDGMTKEASAMHTAYPEYLRKSVQRRILQNDSPFTSDLFQEASWDKRDEILKQGGAIILASSGMLTGGPSVDYLHRMAEDPNNTLIFVGYQGEGSVGRKLQRGVKELPVQMEGKTKALQMNLRVETVEGFSGHSDRNELTNYIRMLKPKPKRVLVNHGDKSNTAELANFVNHKFRINASSPQNLDVVRLK
jgi:predicted metal-dependent RNase